MSRTGTILRSFVFFGWEMKNYDFDVGFSGDLIRKSGVEQIDAD